MFDWLLNHPKADFDAGQLTFASTLSPWLLVALALLAALLLGLSLWRRKQDLSTNKLWTLWTLQALVATLLLILFWQPSLKINSISAGENSVVVLLDSSASMQVESQGASRYATAVDELTTSIIPALEKHFSVKTATFGNQLNWVDNLPTPAGNTFEQRSNISTALIDVLDQARVNPLTAVVLASDGSDNSQAITTAFWDELSNYNVPVHTIGIGRTNLPDDTEVVSVDLPSTAMPGSVQTARVTVQHGNQESLRVKVYSGDDIIAIEERTLPKKAGLTTIDVEISAEKTGMQALRFEAEASASDISPQNNSRSRLLQVAEQKRKVLYFEGEPRWEYKFIRRAMHKAPSISLVTILRTTPNKFYRQGIESPEQHAGGFPETKEELYLYDAVIIGNVESVSMNAIQQQLLHDYVSERGGTLLMLAGDKALSDGGWQNSPVAKTLPVSLLKSGQPTYSRVHAKANLTGAGNYSPITRFIANPADNESQWSILPELADFQRTGESKPGANVLLTTTINNRDYPLLTHQRYGKGNSYLLATSGTWRWQMQLPSEDQHHETFWRQLLHSIAATAPQQMQVSSDRQIYLDDSTVKLSATLFDKRFNPLSNGVVTANLTSPEGTKSTVVLAASAEEPGIYSVNAEAPQTGSWQIDIEAQDSDKKLISSSTSWVHREDGTAEYYALAQNDDLLKRIASSTQGKYHSVEDAQSIAETLRTARSGIVREQTLPLWNAPLFFLLLIGLKLLEWFLRLRWGRL